MTHLEYKINCPDAFFDKKIETTLFTQVKAQRGTKVHFKCIGSHTILFSFLGDLEQYPNAIGMITAKIQSVLEVHGGNTDRCTIKRVYENHDFDKDKMTVSQLINRLKFLQKDYARFPVKIVNNKCDLKQVTMVRTDSDDTIALTVGFPTNEIYKCMTVSELLDALSEYDDFDRVLLFTSGLRDTLIGVSVSDKGYVLLEGLTESNFPRKDKNYM